MDPPFPYWRDAARAVEHDLRLTNDVNLSIRVDESGQLELRKGALSTSRNLNGPRDIIFEATTSWLEERGHSARSLYEKNSLDEVATAALSCLKEIGGVVPTCPIHRDVELVVVIGKWTCLMHSRRPVARVGELQDVSIALVWDAIVSIFQPRSIRISENGALLRALRALRAGLRVRPPGNSRQAVVAWMVMWGTVAQVKGLPFYGVHLFGLTTVPDQALLALALLLLSMMGIDVIVTLPMILAWVGVLGVDQTATAIMVVLSAHAFYSPTVGKVFGSTKNIRLQALPSIPLLGLGLLLPRIHYYCDEWAARHGADGTVLFATFCVAGCALSTGLALAIRQQWNLDDRKSENIYRETFWAMLTIFIALVPVAFRAALAPTLLGAIAVPLVIVRARISAAKEAEAEDEDIAHGEGADKSEAPEAKKAEAEAEEVAQGEQADVSEAPD